LEEAEQKRRVISIEGGDIMMVSPRHLLVGCSERTSPEAGIEIMQELFRLDIGIEQVTIVKIPSNRAQMHIDTIFTQVRRDVWALYGEFSQELWEEEIQRRRAYSLIADDPGYVGPPVELFTFHRGKHRGPYDRDKDYALTTDEDYQRLGMKGKPTGLDGLLRQISVTDFGCRAEDVKIVYSGNDEFPYDEREQWTDACNYLALREGVVIGYDRNEKTAVAFRNAGFEVIKALDLITAFESGERDPATIDNVLIELPSAELSRARGGSHCMSMPLRRKPWTGK
jgi:arginine deiminase